MIADYQNSKAKSHSRGLAFDSGLVESAISQAHN